VGSATGQTGRLLVPTDTVQIGERFHVVLIVERPATATARIPDPALGDTVLGDLELLRVERRSRGLADGSGLARDSMRYEVTTFALDTAFVPPLEVHLLSDRDTLVVRTAPYLIPARSVVPADAEDIQDLAPLVEFPRSLWPWILLGTILLVGAILGYLWHRRRKNRDVDAPPPPPPVPPYEEAMTRLKRLDEATLDEESD